MNICDLLFYILNNKEKNGIVSRKTIVSWYVAFMDIWVYRGMWPIMEKTKRLQLGALELSSSAAL